VTSTAADVAADRLQWLADHSPDAWRLGRLASPAVRIEPHLLRSLRIELLPDADVGTEADLWFSGIVESQGVDAIVLDAQVADLLRNDLAAEAGLFRRSIAIITRAHEHLPSALRLEERINALALIEGAAAIGRIDDELRAAIRAMTQSAERAGEIARWVLRAWPRLHEVVRNTPAAATLALAASALLRRRMTGDPLAARARLTELSWILPPVDFTSHVDLGVELLDTALVFSQAGAGPRLRVPETKPPLVELEWYVDGEQHVQVVDAVPDRMVDLGGTPGFVRIGTLNGAEYVARREAETGAPVAAEPEWLDLSPYDAIADACVRVAPPGESETPVEWTTAFYIDPRTLATSRQTLEGVDSLRIAPAAGTRAYIMTNIGTAGDVLLIEPATGLAQSEPVQLATPPVTAAAPESGGELRLQPTRVVILGHDGDTLRAVEGQAWVADLGGREYVVTLDRPALPDGFIGGPVVIENKVRGLVASIEIRTAPTVPPESAESHVAIDDRTEAADSVVCHVAGSRTIVDAYEQLRKARAAKAAESPAQEVPIDAQQTAPDFAQNAAPDFAQEVADESAVEPAPARDAGGPRFAKVVVVGDRGAGKSELIRALAEASSPPIAQHSTLAWIERPATRGIAGHAGAAPAAGRGSGGRAGRSGEVAGGPAGLMFYECTADPRWPIELDLGDAALVLIAASVIGNPGSSVQAWIHRVQRTAAAAPLLIVGTQTDANPEVATLAEREINALAAAVEIRQTGGSGVALPDAEEPGEADDGDDATSGAEPPRVVSARTRMNIDALRTAIVERIDWSLQPFIEPRAFEDARSSAGRTLSSLPPIAGGTTHLPGASAAGWYDALAPLAGERRVADGIIIHDPSLFEALVLAIIEIGEKRFNNVPAARVDEVARRWPDYISRWPQLSSLEVDPATVIRGVASELERYRLALPVTAGNTEVIALPSLVGTEYMYPPDPGATPILGASWTGQARDILISLAVRIAWEQGTVRQLNWDRTGLRGWAQISDPDLFIEAADHEPTAELHVLATDRSAQLEASRIAAGLRDHLESLLRGNASLSFEEGEGSSYLA
jgi:hypothetical protein